MEFSSLKAFVKFVLHIKLELQSYPDRVEFTVSPIIGHLGFVTDVVICNYSILVKHRKSMSVLIMAVVDNFWLPFHFH